MTPGSRPGGGIAKSGHSFEDDPYQDVASWMQEMGRRHPDCAPVEAASAQAGPPNDWRSGRSATRKLLLFAVLSVSVLQYYFLDVMVQVSSMPVMVFFVPMSA